MILLTGGAGYIGSHCVKCLLQKHLDVIVLDNLARGFRDAVLSPHFVQGSIGDRATLDRIFAAHRIDAVMHFSALAYVCESVEKPAEYYENNVAQTLALLTACRDHGVKHFIFSSTCATYGDVQKVPITEDAPVAPLNPYGHSKRMIEIMLADFGAAYGITSVCFRYFNAAGADPDGVLAERHVPETHLIPLVLQVAKGQREQIDVYGADYPTPDGTCIRDYIHVNDLSAAHILGLEYLRAGNPSTIFNLGSESGYSVREIIAACSRVTGRPIKTRETARRPGDAPRLVADSRKAKSILHWQPSGSDLPHIIRTAWNSMNR